MNHDTETNDTSFESPNKVLVAAGKKNRRKTKKSV